MCSVVYVVPFAVSVQRVAYVVNPVSEEEFEMVLDTVEEELDVGLLLRATALLLLLLASSLLVCGEFCSPSPAAM